MIGHQTLDITGGHIVVVPAGISHALTNTGIGLLRQVTIHPAAHMATVWLDRDTAEDGGTP